MRKKDLRFTALVLLFAMMLCMSACSRNEAPETQPSASDDPMVRIYYPTETLTEDTCIRYEYEENWWEKDAFKVVEYQLIEDGEREILTERVYIGNVEVSTNMYWPEPGSYGMHYYQWDTTYRLYENGEVIYSRTDMGTNRFGHICDVATIKYDEYGRTTESRTQGFYEEGYGPMDGDPDGISESRYEYVSTESGSIGTCRTGDDYTQTYYDLRYRHIRNEYYSENELRSYSEYEYNSAGCVVKSTFCRVDDGMMTWSKFLYETVEVPLSVAEKYPMFRWEYVE